MNQEAGDRLFRKSEETRVQQCWNILCLNLYEHCRTREHSLVMLSLLVSPLPPNWKKIHSLIKVSKAAELCEFSTRYCFLTSSFNFLILDLSLCFCVFNFFLKVIPSLLLPRDRDKLSQYLGVRYLVN